MPKLIVSAGGITVVIKDDRAEMDKATLKAWKQAAIQMVEAAVDHFQQEPEEGDDDGED